MPSLRGQDDLATESDGNQTPFGRRIGVSEPAAKRSPHADRIMRNMPRHEGQKLAESIRVRPRAMEECVAHRGANRKMRVIHIDAIQSRDSVDIDQGRRIDHTKRHHRHQTLSARENQAALVGDAGQQPHRILDSGRPMQQKRGRLHCIPSPSTFAWWSSDLPQLRAAVMYLKSICGEIGALSTYTPRSLSASSIADMIAPATGITPDSPTPLTPREFIVLGDSRCRMSTGGISAVETSK